MLTNTTWSAANSYVQRRDIELVHMEKFVTVLLEDTFGISKLLPDYPVETTFRKVKEHFTEVTISHYSISSLKARLFNLVGKTKIAREAQATLNAIEAQIERGDSDRLNADHSQ